MQAVLVHLVRPSILAQMFRQIFSSSTNFYFFVPYQQSEYLSIL